MALRHGGHSDWLPRRAKTLMQERITTPRAGLGEIASAVDDKSRGCEAAVDQVRVRSWRRPAGGEGIRGWVGAASILSASAVP